jgi:thioredoxin 1
MNKTTKITIVIILILVVGVVIAIKESNKANSESKVIKNLVENLTAKKTKVAPNDETEEMKALPRLVDLGADKCIPCKMMAPILEELKSQYQGKLEVVFIDVWEKPDEAKKYKINIIPTQIFYDAGGKELFRHEGFFSKEDILAKWNELGIDIQKGQKDEKTN